MKKIIIYHLYKAYFLFFIFSVQIVWGPSIFAMEISLTVEEPAGIERISEPVTSGIPLPLGLKTTNWSLWDGAQEIPLQITKLQGRTPWILLDFEIDVDAFEKKTLTLRDTASSVTPPRAVVISEDSNQIIVTTGPLKVLMNKNPFNLFEAVWLDRDNNGSFSDTEKIINSSDDNIQILDSTTGQTFSGKVIPDRIEWEYQGTMRSTLRVDGKYISAQRTACKGKISNIKIR